LKSRRTKSSTPTAVYEWGFVGLMFCMCVVLSALQYKWTGQISSAETARLRATLGEGLQTLCRAFDSELTQSCRALVPSSSEIADEGHDAAHMDRFQAWAKKAKPIFRRIGVAIPTNREVALYEIRPGQKHLIPVAWPVEWADLKKDLFEKPGPERSAAFTHPLGTVFAFPVLAGRGKQVIETEWTIFELDSGYLREKWMPRLMRRHLGQHVTNLLASAEIKTRAQPHTTIYALDRTNEENAGKVYSATFNSLGGSPGFGGMRTGDRWIFELRQSPSRLEQLVSTARWRNFALATLFNGLLLAAGLALVRYTRRSRVLADAQLQFVANVSHELRTPLTVILGAGHNLLKGVVQDKRHVEQYLKLIVKHAQHLSEMVEQLLELRRTRKKQKLTQMVDITKIISEALGVTSNETKGFMLDLELAQTLAPVRGDAAALQRAFQNLITNAARHGRKGGWIGIKAGGLQQNGSRIIEVQVADRGDGIPENEVDQLFDPFFRGAAAEIQRVRGSGLGLTLVKEIVEAHNGTISLESQEGKGTTFSVRLPAMNGV
jgi:signal transduction histidine kinase